MILIKTWNYVCVLGWINKAATKVKKTEFKSILHVDRQLVYYSFTKLTWRWSPQSRCHHTLLHHNLLVY